MKFKFLVALLLAIVLVGCSEEQDEIIVISTPYGDMTAVLFDETPLHKENFLKLAKSGMYDSVLFHRVINEFMIQTGNLATGKLESGVKYTLPAEFMAEKYIHEKGALAAARTGDASNPEKKSSGSQFYIVHGEKFDNEGLAARADRRQYLKLSGLFQRMLRSERFPDLTEKYNYHVNKFREDSTYNFNQAQRDLIFNSIEVIEEAFGPQADPGYPDWAKEVYATIGGAPHLDGQYTVFGKVVEGLEVIDQIAGTATNQRDRPLEDIRMDVKVVSMSKSEITKKYGITYPK
ncbi:peptidylprolyl isomerase [Roseivirga sp. E12]|uniref:peptidylprolyl isomerase n=1 Tax=Roseivirga sp. E12 TaxID=2819237 RepID=UPI001ABCFBCC|nr:peptidylprolyl isomerase [Roseivirga sp. E12]MBO3699612.1 peptidylprolyl isomerase [Roseivirga sp. E12]